MARKCSDPARELECTAYHEAGHAVAAWRLGRRFGRVTIKPDLLTLGQCRILKDPRFTLQDHREPAFWKLVEDRIVISLAGPIAEAKFRGRPNRAAAEGDMQIVEKLLWNRTMDASQHKRCLAWLKVVAGELLDDCWNWAMVEVLAKNLLVRQTLSGREVVALLRGAWNNPDALEAI